MRALVVSLRSTLLAGLALLGCDVILGLERAERRPDDQASGGTAGSVAGSAGTEAGRGGAGDGGSTGGKGAAGQGVTGGGTGIGEAAAGGEAGDGGAGGSKPECEDGDVRCRENAPETCADGVWEAGTVCPSYCLRGECRNPPSCNDPEPCRNGVSCCSSIEVPGGSFIRDFDGVIHTNQTFHANVSAFLLDRFEVTVGRLRRFVDAYPSIRLSEGDGKAPHIADDTGWRESYELPATADELRAQLACPDSTWTDDATGDEQLPANCVNFYVAYAFCIWDGGRLPTEAEWNFAAAGGEEQRVYPWSIPPSDATITNENALFGQRGGLPLPVGSKQLGNGAWGHSDLAGSLYEWTLDFYADTYPSTRCNDCLVATGSGTRSIRGGAFAYDAQLLIVSARGAWEQVGSDFSVGFRCARDLATHSPIGG